LKDVLTKAKVENPVDMDHIRLALQGYNFGSGYITYAMEKDGGYTVQNVSDYSDKMAKEKGWTSYGDKQYVTHVIQYYPYGSYNYGVGNTVIVNIACGLPQFAEENIEEYVSLPEALFGKGPFYILRARGESMIDAGIDPGDLVVIRSQEEAKEGDIVVALIDNEATLKRFYRDKKNKRIRLHPENETMEDIFVDNCNIQGVAVNVIKQL
jgi:repressor LexA